jgi:predicted  nucleic acid-binding Zn-ribbon protein
MKKYISISYKELYSIVEAVDQKIVSDEEKCRASLDEDERSDLQNDIAFAKAYLRELKTILDDWPSLLDIQK